MEKELTIQESNRLIAEFMGATLIGSDWHIKGRYMTVYHKKYPDSLRYNECWAWIMPVVEEIQTMENGRWFFTVEPYLIECIDYKEYETQVFKLEFDSETILFDQYYAAVLEFIRWYNLKNDL